MGSARPRRSKGSEWRRTIVGLIRVVHPFPSLLDGLLTAGLVLIAGGEGEVAARLGLAMIALQAAIGTVNDLVDEPLDRGRKSGKPLPRGLVSRRAAMLLVGASLVVGLGLSALSGAAVLVVAVVGTAIGLVYDRWLKGTIWSWLPFALGIPLLPVYAWLGATGGVPSSFGVLIPAAALAGASLAIANLLADAERDAAAGLDTVATRLGVRRAWRVGGALHLAVLAIAGGSLLAIGGRGAGLAGVVAGAAVVTVGLVASRGAASSLRERGWELQAAGVGILAAGWVAAVAEAGSLR